MASHFLNISSTWSCKINIWHETLHFVENILKNSNLVEFFFAVPSIILEMCAEIFIIIIQIEIVPGSWQNLASWHHFDNFDTLVTCPTRQVSGHLWYQNSETYQSIINVLKWFCCSGCDKTDTKISIWIDILSHTFQTKNFSSNLAGKNIFKTNEFLN